MELKATFPCENLGKKDITSLYHIYFYVYCHVLLLKRLMRDSSIRQHASA